MDLYSLLSERILRIQKSWFDILSHSYPDQTAKFLVSKTDRFANPVGHVFRKNSEAILDHLLKRSKASVFRPLLEEIVRIRAVQEFTPSQATGFIFLLKTAIRKELKNSLSDPDLFCQLLEFESKIDGLALIAFDCYLECREKVYEIRATELRGRTRKFMERLQYWTDREGEPSDLEIDNPGTSSSKEQQGGGK